MLPNQYIPDLCGIPKSMSSHLKFGCVSVRRLYWAIQDTYVKVFHLFYSRDDSILSSLMIDVQRLASMGKYATVRQFSFLVLEFYTV